MTQEPNLHDAVDQAWHVHSAIDSWTAKVDVKASIVLSLQTVVLATAIVMTQKDKPLEGLEGFAVWGMRLGFLLLVIGVILAGGVVFPQLRRHATDDEWRINTIYFGHLRRWEPSELAQQLAGQTDQDRLNLLARQHVRMSEIAWRKHAWLQYSMLSGGIGGVLVVLSGTI